MRNSYDKAMGRGGLCVLGLVLPLTVSCGGSTQQAKEPEPAPLEDPAPAKEQSPQLKAAIDDIQAGKFALAEEKLSALRKSDGGNAEVAFYSGVTAEGLGKADVAEGYYRQAIERDAKLVDAAANLSALLIDAENYQGALQVIEKALPGNPDHEGLLNNKAAALLQRGDAKQAAAVYAKLAQQHPDNEDVRALQAEALLLAGDAAQAAKVAKSLLGSDSRAVLALVADLMGRMGQFDSCVKALSKAIGLKDAGELRVQRGLCYHSLKQEEQARADFEKATELDPQSAAAFFFLGSSFAGAKQPARAREAFKKAQQLDPDGQWGARAGKALAKLK